MTNTQSFFVGLCAAFRTFSVSLEENGTEIKVEEGYKAASQYTMRNHLLCSSFPGNKC